MKQDLHHTTALLARTPAVLDAMLRGLPDFWVTSNEGPNTWSVSDVLVHLNHCERADWMPRLRTILRSGETQSFEPFDRWTNIDELRGQPIEPFLDEFSKLRSSNLSELEGLALESQDLDRRGRHPALGEVSLSELIATWATHDLTHLHQISRIMAHQYREAVGPWSGHLGVLQCAGHSN
jgi:hypothetical protein